MIKQAHLKSDRLESRDVQNYLEESNNELTREKLKLQHKLADGTYEKKVILAEKEERH
ncbi:hypothetical protein [Carnobacterium gallinarum]|uniref:hypothetical protein n=1 Tax=Carnobacterium gallinarum TaxID=2749 RepID=UPI00147058F8|nr:hypothetical protein [Carnobacterium gallinarum]